MPFIGKKNPVRLRDVIIAIDAGHGGDDPGAIGKHGVYEKDVVLAIAKRLKKLIDKEPGMRPLLIRKGDYFVSLSKRKKIARKKRADMFVSIHADAYKNSRARGVSVYAVSLKGASSEAARLLAESENETDLMGGVSLDEKDDVLTNVLLDLSKTGTIETSIDVGTRVLKELKNVGKLHRPRVEQAGFVVLKSLGMPSILVETGFVSNKLEERKLQQKRYQQRLAVAMLNGIRGYFKIHAPPGAKIAAAELNYTIQHGDTLSQIAHQHKVTTNKLKHVNRLSSDTITVGQILQIPQGS